MRDIIETLIAGTIVLLETLTIIIVSIGLPVAIVLLLIKLIFNL